MKTVKLCHTFITEFPRDCFAMGEATILSFTAKQLEIIYQTLCDFYCDIGVVLASYLDMTQTAKQTFCPL